MANPNPSPNTRFQKGNPGGGNKFGPKGVTVTKRANAKLDDMLGLAHKNVKAALKRGNVSVSTWLIDTARKERGTTVEQGLLEPLVNALESLDDVEKISKQAVLLAINGDMSFEQLKAVQEALARHSVLAGVIELRKLRDEVDRMAEDDRPEAQIGRDHLPDWGKLKDATPDQDVKTNGDTNGQGEG